MWKNCLKLCGYCQFPQKAHFHSLRNILGWTWVFIRLLWVALTHYWATRAKFILVLVRSLFTVLKLTDPLSHLCLWIPHKIWSTIAYQLTFLWDLVVSQRLNNKMLQESSLSGYNWLLDRFGGGRGLHHQILHKNAFVPDILVCAGNKIILKGAKNRDAHFPPHSTPNPGFFDSGGKCSMSDIQK